MNPQQLAMLQQMLQQQGMTAYGEGNPPPDAGAGGQEPDFDDGMSGDMPMAPPSGAQPIPLAQPGMQGGAQPMPMAQPGMQGGAQPMPMPQPGGGMGAMGGGGIGNAMQQIPPEQRQRLIQALLAKAQAGQG